MDPTIHSNCPVLCEATLLDRATDRRCVLVDVAGEIDILSRPALAEALGAAVDSGADVVVVDLSAVRLLSAAGIHCLQDAAEPLARRGGRLHVICPRAGVASRILRLFDSDGRLLLHDDLAAALESVNASR